MVAYQAAPDIVCDMKLRARSVCPRLITLCMLAFFVSVYASAPPCAPGEYDNAGTCTACPAGSWCASDTQNTCPAGTTSDPSADAVEDCYCNDGTYDVNGDPAVFDCQACPADNWCVSGVATACTTCLVSEYESQSCTSTQDAACTTCSADHWCDGTTETACTTCLASEYESANCTSSQDATCATCTADHWCDGTTQTACATCLASEYVSSACSSTADTVCATCTAGSWCNGTTQTTCPAGTTSAAGADAQTDCYCNDGTYDADADPGVFDCQPCAAGSWCAAGVVTACAAGTTSVAGSDAADDCLCASGTYGAAGGPCTACTTCNESQYESTACTSTADRVCSPCGVDYWCDVDSNPHACTLLCAAGEGITTACNASADAVCTTCVEGDYATDSAPCDAGWTHYADGGMCYKLMETVGDYGVAVTTCAAVGARPPEVFSSAQDIWILNQFDKHYVLGAEKIADNTWIWPSTNEVVQSQADGGCLDNRNNNDYLYSDKCCGGCLWVDIFNWDNRAIICEKAEYPTSNVCETCEADSYCNSGLATACPANSQSPAGSSELADCVCSDGYWDADEAIGVLDCQFCPDGHTCTNNVKSVCPANYWCTGGVKTACLATFVSAEGSHMAANCTCSPGWEVDPGLCAEGYTEYLDSGRCYKLADDVSRNLIAANDYCIDDGATLPMKLETIEEWNYLSDMMGGHAVYWVNAWRDGNNGPVHWIDGFQYGTLTVNNVLEEVVPADFGLGPIGGATYLIYFRKEGTQIRGATWTNNAFVRCQKPKPADVCVELPSPCSPGTYGSVVEGCKTCEMGYYCPGGADRFRCPNDALTDPLYGALSADDCAAPTCGNFRLEQGEECDNGPSGGDGCSATCEFEDSSGTAAGPEWVCTTSEPLATTSCCPSVQNPISLAYVCNCDGVVSNVSGVSINSDCSVTDVDECRTDNGGCVLGALCVNHPKTLTSNQTHECICPPGMFGDGIVRCDIYVYQVTFKVAVQAVSIYDVDENDIKQRLLDGGVFPEGTTLADITIHVTEYSGSFSSRRLLGTGVEIEASVETDSSLEMEETQASIDTSAAMTAVAESFGNDTVVEMTQQPASEVLTVDQVFGTVGTILTGFKVESVSYDNVKWEWIIRARYVDGAPNVITSMYMSKTGAAPYSQDVQNTYYIGQQPCMLTSSVCCLNDFKAMYTIGSFADNITSELGACDATIAAKDTLGMFNVGQNSKLVENMLSAYPNSYVKRINPTTVDIHLHRVDLRDSFAMSTDVVGGYDMDFFLGMAYYTMLPAPALSTVVSQTRIKARYTDTVSFSSSSQQDYTLLQYMTVAVFDTKVIRNVVDEHHPQMVRVSFVVPDNLQQNMRTGLVPLTSVRYSIAKSLPEQDDVDAWKNPCLSVNGGGLWDPAAGLRDLYNDAAGQTCALRPDICTNPLQAEIRDRFIEFWVPIGDNTINATIAQSTKPYSIYIYFDISLVDAAGRYIQTKLFAQAPITEFSLTQMCQDVEAANEVKDIMDVSLAVGIVGVESEWASTVRTFDNILSGNTDLLGLSINVTTPTVQNGLVTIVLHGVDESFTGALAVNYQLEIDDLVTLHFLDDTVYNTVAQKFKDGNAWTLVKDGLTGYLKINLDTTIVESCISAGINGDLTCAIRNDISGRSISEAYAVHPLATGMNTHDINVDAAWLQKHLLGYSEYSDTMARNFTNIIRSRYNINDRYKKAWYVNPGYPWAARTGSAAQSVLSLSDKTIIVAVVVLDDGTGGGRRRRMLLQVMPDGTHTLKEVVDHPVNSVLPPINNLAVDPLMQIAKAFGVTQNIAFAKFSDVRWKMRGDMPISVARDFFQQKLRNKLGEFAPDASRLWIAQIKPKAPKTGAKSRRLLDTASEAEEQYAADLVVLMEGASFNLTVFTNEANEALTAAIAAGDVNISAPGFDDEDLYDALQDIYVDKFDVLESAHPEYVAQFSRVEMHTLNELAEESGLTTPYPRVYPADNFGDENAGSAMRVGWLSVAVLGVFCVVRGML